jgi:GTPase Era involved in 16S rRNA processing
MGKIITVIGEFSSGKSTIMNALIRFHLLSVSVKSTTAIINTINYLEKN